MVHAKLFWVFSMSIYVVVSSSLVPVAELFPPKPYKFGYAIKDKHGEQYREETGDGLHDVKGSYGFVDDRGIKRQVNYIADEKGFRAEVKTNEPGTAPLDPAAVKMISSAPAAEVKSEEKKLSSIASELEKLFKQVAEESKEKLGFGESLAKEYFVEKEKAEAELAKKETAEKELTEAGAKLALEQLAKLGFFVPYPVSKEPIFDAKAFAKKSFGYGDLKGFEYIAPEEFFLSALHHKAKYALEKKKEEEKLKKLEEAKLAFAPFMSSGFIPILSKEKAAKELGIANLMKGIALAPGLDKKHSTFIPIY